MKKFLIFLVLLYNSLLSLSTNNNNNIDKKNILFVNFYSDNSPWIKTVQDSLYNSFSTENPDYTFFSETINTNTFLGDEFFREYKKYFTKKYQKKKIDLVIVTDCGVLKFILKKDTIPNLFDNTPILIVGMDNSRDLEKITSNKKFIHTILEQPNYEGNIYTALKQNPTAKKIILINDETNSGKNIEKKLNRLLNKVDINYIWTRKLNIKDIKSLIKEQDKDTIIIFYHFIFDKSNNIFYNYREIVTELAKISPVPIYINHHYYLGTGALGGNVYSEKELAASAYIYAKKLLNSEKLAPIINLKQHDRYVFDYEVIKKYNMYSSYFPSNSSFVNKQKSFVEKYIRLIILHIIVLIIFIIICILIFSNIQKRKIILKNNILLTDTQKELLYRIGNIIELRCQETKYHVERVGEIAKFIALEMGYNEKEANLILIASPLHDVGKIGIPDDILNFPGKLSDEQFEIMKQHTTIGYDILKNSQKEIIETAAIIAHQHHERWDGQGYPNRLKEHEIHPYAQITMIADIIDALLSKRAYKKAWHYEDIITLIEKEKGKMFNPMLVDIVLKNSKKILKIRNKPNIYTQY